MTQIPYAVGQAPPSWTWMRYYGPIEYFETREVEWDRSVRFVKASNAASNLGNTGYILEARVRRLQDCEIKPEGPKQVIHDQKDNEVGHLRFDTQLGKDSTEVRCAIMGRETKRADDKRDYYVLFVTECSTPPGCGKYERVGIGSIQQRFIRFDTQDDVAQIF
jgi:hypothetical protein